MQIFIPPYSRDTTVWFNLRHPTQSLVSIAVKMKSTLVLSVLVSLNGSGTFAGTCKPMSSQATQVMSVTTKESTAIDVSTSLVASENIFESLIAPTAESSTAELSGPDIGTLDPLL